jgi:hypothetical protein
MFWRATVALVVAPIVVSLGMVLTFRPSAGSLEDQAAEVFFVAFVYYLYPLFFALVFALPLYLLLNRFGLVNWWVSLAAGLLVGGIGAASHFDQGLWLSVRLVVLGGIAGLVFWRILSTYRPPKATW